MRIFFCHMKSPVRLFICLLFYSMLVFILSALLIHVFKTGLTPGDLLLPGLVFPLLIAVSLLVFIAGRSKPSGKQPVFTMAALGIKFFLTSVFAIFYFIIIERTGTGHILLFFLLYLVFTVYLLSLILKALKVK